MKALDIIVAILMIIGTINLGLVGFFDVNVLATLFGEGTALLRVIYALIGLSGVYELGGITFGKKELHGRWHNRWCSTEATVKH